MVRATDVAGNVSAVRLHVNYSAALSPPASLQISPASANVLVGSTQQFTALDDVGRPRTDATWTVDNSSIATITTDSSPVLTGVAAGTVTLTTSVGGISTQIQVNVLAGTSLPVGTVLWSAPSTPGFTVQQIAQAIPTTGGPDLYSIEMDSNNTPLVRALSSGGQQFWNKQLPSGSFPVTGIPSYAMPDGNGGILMTRITTPGAVPPTYQLVDLDAQTGTQMWSYDLASNFNAPSQTTAIRGDGTIFKVQGVQGKQALIGIDPNTGAMTFLYKPPDSTYAFLPGIPNCPSTVTGTAPSTLSPPTVGPDGTVYSVVSQFNLTLTDGCDLGPLSYTLTDSLLQVAPDGSTSLTQIRQDVSNQTYNGGSFAGTFAIPGSNITVNLYQPIPTFNGFHVIPDGQGGALIPYAYAVTAAFAQSPLTGRITHMASGGALNDFSLPLIPSGGTVLGENGTAFATDASSVVSFSPSGSVNWVYAAANGVASLFAADGGGVTLSDGAANFIALDASGIASTPIPGFANASPWSVGSAAWFGTADTGPLFFAGISSELVSSPWPSTAGEPPQQNAANPTGTIIVNFTGIKSQGDQLDFSGDGACGQNLGLRYCPNSSWTFYVEGVATVSDDASKWRIRQTAVITRAGKTKDAGCPRFWFLEPGSWV